MPVVTANNVACISTGHFIRYGCFQCVQTDSLKGGAAKSISINVANDKGNSEVITGPTLATVPNKVAGWERKQGEDGFPQLKTLAHVSNAQTYEKLHDYCKSPLSMCHSYPLLMYVCSTVWREKKTRNLDRFCNNLANYSNYYWNVTSFLFWGRKTSAEI